MEWKICNMRNTLMNVKEKFVNSLFKIMPVEEFISNWSIFRMKFVVIYFYYYLFFNSNAIVKVSRTENLYKLP